MSAATPQTPLLEGITVLNLARVGPAARAARTLADYGARIIPVSPTARPTTGRTLLRRISRRKGAR